MVTAESPSALPSPPPGDSAVPKPGATPDHSGLSPSSPNYASHLSYGYPTARPKYPPPTYTPHHPLPASYGGPASTAPTTASTPPGAELPAPAPNVLGREPPLLPPPASCPITANGSYVTACRSCAMVGCVLTCDCMDGSGGWPHSSLDVLTCRYGSIRNDQGQLRCDTARGTYSMAVHLQLSAYLWVLSRVCLQDAVCSSSAYGILLWRWLVPRYR